MRKIFIEELSKLNTYVIEMGAFVERANYDALKALRKRDHELANEVIRRAKDVNDMDSQIEGLALSLLLRQQPVAKDLRFISAVLKIVTDLERIGDHAQDIAEISLTMPDEKLSTDINPILDLYEEASNMMKMSLDAFISMDANLAKECIEKDDEVDQLFLDMRTRVIKKLQASEGNPEELIDLLQIAKYLERVGDHSENIAHAVYYAITGEYLERDDNFERGFQE